LPLSWSRAVTSAGLAMLVQAICALHPARVASCAPALPSVSPATLWWWNTTDLLSGKNAGHPGRTVAGCPVSSTISVGPLKVLVVLSKPIMKSFCIGLGVVPPRGLKARSAPSGENAGVPRSGNVGVRPVTGITGVAPGSGTSCPTSVSAIEPSGYTAGNVAFGDPAGKTCSTAGPIPRS